MASSSSTNATTVTLPQSLAFLVSNFHSLVNIKLESGNYLLWRTQVMNALRANGYLEYLDYTKSSPEPTILNTTTNERETNPEFTLWTLIDNQLLSCLTSSLSSATLPHVLGFTHVCQVWHVLEQRFNSLSKSHIHELKDKLYTITKTRSMDEYIDEIRGYSQKLEAIGYHIDDDDVFYALKGLPTEFKGVRSALTAKGDVTFDELATILKHEESQIHRDEGMNNTKVFLTIAPNAHSQGLGSTSGQIVQTGAQVVQSSILGPSPQHFSVPMYQTTQASGPYFPTTQQVNRNTGYAGGYQNNGGFQRSRNGGRNGSKTECQICGKTNHTALYCYHRQNLQYQPYQNTQFQPQFQSYPSPGGQFQPQFQSYSSPGGQFQPYLSTGGQFQSYPSAGGQFSGTKTGPSQSWNNGQQFTGMNGISQRPPQPQANIATFSQDLRGVSTGSTGYSSQGFIVASPMPMYYGNNGQGGQQQLGQGCIGRSGNISNTSLFQPSVQQFPQQPHPSNWYFDSGASSHVTNDLRNLSLSQTCSTNDGVMVGNGSSLPINHTGQYNSSDTSQGTMCEGVVPHSDLLL